MGDSRGRCLVTGGAGFIGSHLVDSLVADGNAVRVVDNLTTGHRENLDAAAPHIEFIEGDIRDPAICRRSVADVVTVFHVAALPSVPRSLADPWESHDVNVNGTVRLLLAAREAGVRRLVYSSSSSAYGDTPVLPKAEEAEPLPRSPYAASKLAGEQYVLAFARAGLLEGVALRYFNVFGPRQDPNSAYAAVVAALMKAALGEERATIFGDGRQTRDFTYVENVVRANRLSADAPAAAASGFTLNIGGGGRTSLLDLLGTIESVSGKRISCEHSGPRAGDVRDSLADLDRAGRVIGYQPRVSVEEGLRRTWQWFVEQQAPDRRTSSRS